MSVFQITETTDADDLPSDLRRAWALDCTDAFGRAYVLVITAYRAPGAGVGFKSPTGEFGFVDVDRLKELDYVLAEARRFIYGDQGGDRRCTRRN